MFTDAFPIISTPDMQRALSFCVARVLDPDGNELIIGQRARED